ncbi:MAG TPA: nitroreductase family protein [Acidimicrobiales bacterium]
MADIWDVIHSQRACRAFRDDDVDDATIARVLDAATFAPSAENRQPWIFVVVRDPASRKAIGEINQKAWAAGARAYSEARLTPKLLADVEAGVTGGVSAAPIIIVVCADGSAAHEATLGSSLFPAVQNLLLAATAIGLGSALTTLPTTFGDELRTLLALPGHVHPLAVIPLGWPAKRLGPPRRVPFADKTYRDRYGQDWEKGKGIR